MKIVTKGTKANIAQRPKLLLQDGCAGGAYDDRVSESVQETAAESSLLELPIREIRHNGPSL